MTADIRTSELFAINHWARKSKNYMYYQAKKTPTLLYTVNRAEIGGVNDKESGIENGKVKTELRMG